MIKPSPFFNQFVLKSWWVILFFMICCFAYDQRALHQREQVRILTTKLEKLTTQKEILELQTKELKLQVASQSDPEYIEMVLMRRLGLILEGQKKVLFVPTS